MAHFNYDTGKWIANDGSAHTFEADAKKVGGGGGAGSFESGIFATIWKIFCFIPWLLGLVIGWVCAMLLKLGITGKVILSVLVAAFTFIVLLIPINVLGWTGANAVGTITAIVALAGSLAVGAWFWLKHYDVVKQMPSRNFVALTTECMMICFWGSIGLGILFAILKFGGSAGIGIAMAIALIAAVGWWLFNANKYKSVEAGGTYSDPVPSPIPAAGNRNQPGDLIWARWSQDGNLYFAGIAAGSNAGGVPVVFYDGMKEKVSGEDIFYLPEACKTDMTPHGNWEGKGGFYPCKILKFNESSLSVEYLEDGVKEELPYYGLVFMK